jgi:hypothetical protein
LSRLPDSPIHKLETGLAWSIQLYERVLDDLNTLRRQAPPDQPVPELIEHFYASRLKNITSLVRCIDRIREWESLARGTSRELEETRRTLLQSERLWPREGFLRRLVSDINHELSRRRADSSEKRARAALVPDASCPDRDAAEQQIAPVVDRNTPVEAELLPPPVTAPAAVTATPIAPDRATASLDEEEPAIPSATQRWLEAASEWSSMLKPFLVDNVGWFVGTFLIVAGFVVLLAAFWRDIGANPVLLRSLVFWLLAATTSVLFGLAYYMRRKYPQLETSSNVLLIIVALLIPLVFAAAAVTTLAPSATQTEPATATATASTA